MGQLSDLKGTNGESIDTLFVHAGFEIDIVLRNNMAVTAADNNGALNVWKDDEGNIRCEAMRYCRTLEEKTYKTVEQAIKWVDKWLEKIK